MDARRNWRLIFGPLAAVWVSAANAEKNGAEATKRGTKCGLPSLRDLRPSLMVLDLYTASPWC